MIELSEKVMKRISEIQDKYKFMNYYELEDDDVYDFCRSILQAYYLGLCLDDDDLVFLQKIRDIIG